MRPATEELKSPFRPQVGEDLCWLLSSSEIFPDLEKVFEAALRSVGSTMTRRVGNMNALRTVANPNAVSKGHVLGIASGQKVPSVAKI
jgi:hypothetical protein